MQATISVGCRAGEQYERRYSGPSSGLLDRVASTSQQGRLHLVERGIERRDDVNAARQVLNGDAVENQTQVVSGHDHADTVARLLLGEQVQEQRASGRGRSGAGEAKPAGAGEVQGQFATFSNADLRGHLGQLAAEFRLPR